MKHFLITLLFSFSLMTLHAQTRNFNGLWKGTLNKDDGTDLTLKIYIDNNNVYATHIDEDGDLAKDLNKEVIWSKAFGEQLVFVWIDAGGVWTETQMFSISFVREGKLSVYYTRHVSNESDDYDGNTDWGYTATGYFYQE